MAIRWRQKPYEGFNPYAMYYEPGAMELGKVHRLYPDCDPTDPPWESMRADLALAGVEVMPWWHASYILQLACRLIPPHGGERGERGIGARTTPQIEGNSRSPSCWTKWMTIKERMISAGRAIGARWTAARSTRAGRPAEGLSRHRAQAQAIER